MASAHRRAAGAPFVGRSREFRTLMSKLAAAEREPPQIGAVTGPAGIGKTRLAEEVARRSPPRRARRDRARGAK